MARLLIVTFSPASPESRLVEGIETYDHFMPRGRACALIFTDRPAAKVRDHLWQLCRPTDWLLVAPVVGPAASAGFDGPVRNWIRQRLRDG